MPGGNQNFTRTAAILLHQLYDQPQRHGQIACAKQNETIFRSESIQTQRHRTFTLSVITWCALLNLNSVILRFRITFKTRKFAQEG